MRPCGGLCYGSLDSSLSLCALLFGGRGHKCFGRRYCRALSYTNAVNKLIIYLKFSVNFIYNIKVNILITLSHSLSISPSRSFTRPAVPWQYAFLSCLAVWAVLLVLILSAQCWRITVKWPSTRHVQLYMSALSWRYWYREGPWRLQPNLFWMRHE